MRTVIFDLDGTLADTSGDLIDAANSCFVALGHGPMLMHGADAGTALRGGRAMLRLGFERIGAPWSEADVDAQYRPLLDAYQGSIDRHTRLYPGAMEAVEALRSGGFAVGICTNKPEALARLLLERLGVLGAFAALVGADTLPVRKPDPAALHAAIDQAGGRRDRALLVGDSETDRLTARAAGCPCVLVTFGPEADAVPALEPEGTLSEFAGLPPLAEALLGPA